MRTPWSVSLALVLALGGIAVVYRSPHPQAPDANAPGIEVIGLQVQRPGSGGQPRAVFAGAGEQALCIAAEVRLARGGILGLVAESSQVIELGDDRGTDLRSDDPFHKNCVVDPSGRSLRFFLSSGVPPAREARSIHAQGSIGLRLAERTRTFVSADEAALVPGARFALGPYELELVEVGTLAWNGRSSLTLACADPLDAIASYRLLTRDGRRVDLVPRAGYSAEGTWRQTLEGEEVLAAAALAIEVWENVRVLEVPFRLRTGLGCASPAGSRP